MDLAISAAAGAAAAAAGAHVNGSSLTAEVLQLGALGGVIKSGALNFAILVSSTTSFFTSLLLILLTSSFGVSLLVTLALTQKIMFQSMLFRFRVIHPAHGNTIAPTDLLIAAAAAAAPLMSGTVGLAATGMSRAI